MFDALKFCIFLTCKNVCLVGGKDAEQTGKEKRIIFTPFKQGRGGGGELKAKSRPGVNNAPPAIMQNFFFFLNSAPFYPWKMPCILFLARKLHEKVRKYFHLYRRATPPN